MSEELKAGDWCNIGSVGNDNLRIYLGTFGTTHVCVLKKDEDNFFKGSFFETVTTTRPVYPIKPEFTYPMWFKDTKSELVVRFDSLNSGETIIANGFVTKGYYRDNWKAHTNTREWAQIEEPKYFYVWEREENGMIHITNPMTDELAEKEGFTSSISWKKLEHTKRVGLNLKEIK